MISDYLFVRKWVLIFVWTNSLNLFVFLWICRTPLKALWRFCTAPPRTTHAASNPTRTADRSPSKGKRCGKHAFLCTPLSFRLNKFIGHWLISESWFGVCSGHRSAWGLWDSGDHKHQCSRISHQVKLHNPHISYNIISTSYRCLTLKKKSYTLVHRGKQFLCQNTVSLGA